MNDSQLLALGIGVGTRDARGRWLDVLYPLPRMAPDRSRYAQTLQQLDAPVSLLEGSDLEQLARALDVDGDDALAALCTRIARQDGTAVVTVLETDRPPESPPEAYLKLTLLSHRLALPNSLDLNGLFGVLINTAWTSEGPVDPEVLDDLQLERRLQGRHLEVYSVDKFPRMVNYVVPDGVRIADASRIRLGAHLGAGTTVMHEGQVNFNAGTLGTSMVEGRISQGVIVGANTDLGGGSSTAGTLSGGGNVVISIGESCLISANAGTGIPLGDRCVIEAGLYITPGTRVTVLDSAGEPVRTVRARELSGQSDMLFIRHSETGRVECRTPRSAVELNRDLHDNN